MWPWGISSSPSSSLIIKSVKIVHFGHDIADDAPLVFRYEEELGPRESMIEIVFHLVVFREAVQIAVLHLEHVMHLGLKARNTVAYLMQTILLINNENQAQLLRIYFYYVSEQRLWHKKSGGKVQQGSLCLPLPPPNASPQALQRRYLDLFTLEHFDDIKFGKVFTKFYARLFSMESSKNHPPRFSYALRDLAQYLGIFEVPEEVHRQQKDGLSDVSSTLSFMPSSIHGKYSSLEVITENRSENLNTQYENFY